MKHRDLLIFRYPRMSLLFAGFIVLYCLQLFLPAPNKQALQHYHLTSTSVRVLDLTILLPIVAIWIVALLGYLRFKTYTTLIAGAKDGQAFTTIGYGVALLVLWSPLSTILSQAATQYYTYHPSATTTLVWLNNYFNLILLTAAFWLLYTGSKKLMSLIKTPDFRLYQPTTLIFIAFAVLYTFLVLSDSLRNHAVKGSISSYYSPDWVIVITIVIPRLIAWYVGLQAVQNILLYRHRVKGRLYRKALERLAYGLGGVIGSVIVLRIVQSLTAPLLKANLGALLAIIYVLLIIIAIGYVLIAQGAKRLQKIEEL